MTNSGSRDVRRTRDVELSLRERLARFTRQAARCETFNCWLATDPYRRRSATSMAIVTLNGGWYPSSSNQRFGSALGKGPLRQKVGRGKENL